MFLGSKSLREKVIYLMISFAIGGLLGDVFFHTLPHLNASIQLKQSHKNIYDIDYHHEHNPKEMCNNSIIMTGIIVFFLLEKMVANYLGGGHSHSHEHSNTAKVEVKKGKQEKNKKKEEDEHDAER